MSLRRLMVHDVVLIRAGSTTSRYSDNVRDWGTAARTTAKGWVSRRDRAAGDEFQGEGREAQDRGFVVYLPAGTDVTGLDRVEWDGLTLEIIGPPTRAWNPRMRAEHHVELETRAVTG